MKHFGKKLMIGMMTAAMTTASLMGLSACGEEPIEETIFGDYEYAKKGEAVEIVGYMGEGGELTLPSVINGKSVAGIGANVFYYCETLSSVTIPSSVRSIGSSAFKGCFGLQNVSLSNGLATIGYAAFYDCGSLSKIVIPSTVTSIAWQAFTNCGGLENIVLGGGVQSVGDYAFAGCDGLEAVYYAGTESAWGAIEIGSNNECLVDAERYYFSDAQPTGEGNFWHYVDGVVTAW